MYAQMSIYTYIILFSHYPHHVPSQVIRHISLGYREESQWLIHSKCSSLQLLSPNAQSLPLPPSWQPQVCSPSPRVCFFSMERFFCVIYQIPDISDIIWSLSFSCIHICVTGLPCCTVGKKNNLLGNEKKERKQNKNLF